MMHIMFRAPLLAQLDDLWQRWDKARRSGARPWCAPPPASCLLFLAPWVVLNLAGLQSRPCCCLQGNAV